MKIDKYRLCRPLSSPLPSKGHSSVVLAEIFPFDREPTPFFPAEFTVISKKSTKSCLQIHKSMIYYYNP